MSLIQLFKLPLTLLFTKARPLRLIIFIALPGCVSQPTVDVFVTNVAPIQSTLLEQRARVDLRVQNLSDQPIDATGMTLHLRVNGRRLAQGADGDAFVVPRLGDATTSVVVSAGVLDTVKQLLALPNSTSFAYAVKGKIYTRGATRYFNRSGEISREDLQSLAPLGGAGIPNSPL